MNIRTGKIVGKLEKGEWGLVHDFTPGEQSKLEQQGRLVAVISLRVEVNDAESEPNEWAVVETGREVLSRLHELYYGSGEGGVSTRLAGAMKKIVEEFGGGEIGCIVLVGTAVYVGIVGGVGVWIRVGEKEGWLVKPSGGEEGEKVMTMSGWANEGEVIVMGNGKFWARLPEGVLKAALGHLGSGRGVGMEAAVETLAAVEKGGEEGGGEVGAVVEIERDPTSPEASLGAGELVEEKPEKLNWKEKLVEIRKNLWPERPVFVINQGQPGLKKRTMYVGVGFLVVLVVLFGVGRIRGRMEDERRSQTNVKLEALVYKFNEANSLVGLNPARSRQILAEVQTGLAQLSEKETRDQRIVNIEARMGEVLGAASGTKQVRVEETVDLGLLREGVVGIGISRGEEGKLWVVDGEGDRLIEVDPEKKSGKITAGKADLGEVKEVTGYPGRVVVLSDKGIVGCDGGGAKCAMEAGKDGEWGEIGGMEIWAGNIYLLDKGKGEIWKYQGTEAGGYGAKQKWTGEGQSEGLIGSVGMAIDGNIWVIGQGSVLLKYTRGVQESVNLASWDKSWGAGAKLYTDEETKKLYVLDPGNGRIAAMSKSGEYVGQWVGERIKEAVDMVVDEKAGKIYLVGGRYVWEVEL